MTLGLIATATLAGMILAGSPASAELFPRLIDPAADLGAQTAGPELGWADSIYITSRVDAGGHDVGILLHVVTIPNGPGTKIIYSITDESTNFYRYEVVDVAPEDFEWREGELHISAPGLSWAGNDQAMTVSFEVPWSRLEMTLAADGPVMSYAGGGSFPLFGKINHEFALPRLKTEGTISLEGEEHVIEGATWLDRQWGPVRPDAGARWTWINFDLPNGDALALWDTVGAPGQSLSWATLMRDDGTHMVLDIDALAPAAGEHWTSQESGQTYPARWQVNIPALDAKLTVETTGRREQEMVIHGEGRYEATARFAGTFEGHEVSGRSYVEMFGDWK